MELILISDTKLKIMLTATEMESYDITEEINGYERKDIRKVFSGVLDEARKKTGFDSGAGRLYIQIFPSKDGGCEVYVTRDAEPPRKQAPRERSPLPKLRREYCAYLFGGISSVIDSADALKTAGYDGESVLYAKDHGGRKEYYLILQEDIPRTGQQKKRKNVTKSDIAAEYGKRIGGKEAWLYISEHGEMVIDAMAVERLASK